MSNLTKETLTDAISYFKESPLPVAKKYLDKGSVLKMAIKIPVYLFAYFLFSYVLVEALRALFLCRVEGVVRRLSHHFFLRRRKGRQIDSFHSSLIFLEAGVLPKLPKARRPVLRKQGFAFFLFGILHHAALEQARGSGHDGIPFGSLLLIAHA